MEKIHEFIMPIRTVSEGNSSEHWTAKHKRHRKQKGWVKIYMNGRPTTAPCHVKLTRIAPRKLDAEENLPMSLKYIKDYIADRINPGLAPGRADDDCHGITWEFAQEKGDPKVYKVKVEIFK